MSSRSGLLTALAGGIKPAWDANFLASDALPPGYVFTRSGNTAWRLNASGLLELVNADLPRFDYNYKVPGQLVREGLIFEAAGTNECLRSRDLTNASWTKTNCTAAKDQTGIDGVANSASKITASAANGTCLQAITSASNVSRTFSVYVKRLVGSGNIDITIDNGTTWTTQTITSSWTRVARNQTLANPTVGFRIVTSSDSIAVDFAQEEQSGRSTTPIETVASTVTRNAEQLLASGAGFSNWYRAGKGSLIVEVKLPTGNLSAARAAFSISDNTNNEAWIFYLDAAAGTPALRIVDGGVNQISMTAAAPSIDTVYKYGLSWDFAQPRADGALNGAVLGSSPDTALTEPTVSRSYIGQQGSGSATFAGWIRRIRYYTKKLTPGQLALLTA